MKTRLLVSVGALARAWSQLAHVETAGQSTWKSPRTAWGDPDISGLFTTDDELGVPFERPVTVR